MSLATSAPSTALGTYVELVVTSVAALPAAETLLRAELAGIDAACSRFRSDSELSAVNAGAGRPVAAGPLLRTAVRVAVDAAEATGGLVDPTLGGDLAAAGYDRDFAQLVVISLRSSPRSMPARPIPSPSDCTGPVPQQRRSGWPEIVIDDGLGTVMVPRGYQLDLGATAKALAADRAATAIAERLDVGVLVSLGGDVATAGPAPAGGWAVRTAVNEVDGSDAETVLLSGGAVATSSPEVRAWRRGSQRMHHILDPRTGQPAPVVWRGVSVAAATCVRANATSTAAIVMGEQASAWLSAAGLPARLIGADGRVLRLGSWPELTVWSR